jgi:hypothetical protein
MDGQTCSAYFKDRQIISLLATILTTIAAPEHVIFTIQKLIVLRSLENFKRLVSTNTENSRLKVMPKVWENECKKIQDESSWSG